MIISLALLKYYGLDVIPHVIIYGIIFALLPDIDMIIWLKKDDWRINKWAHEHREHFLHYPLFYLPTVTLILWSCQNYFYIILFIYCSLWHFLHDSFGLGWGLKWLFPISDKWYKFFAAKHDKKNIRFLTTWTSEELIMEVEKRGDDNWHKKKKSYIT
ncbi:MAG: hypothetical protein A2174_00520 [Candidatus Portnoybacteria bacterium RBG_13_41_18]|uniref:Metal-dependent hydrolase n=1 Tax=Candidatus Portnoybacteria bacterium RBG_13_41_18 TaxID=1801991 RepID=A0A1G2FB26_9BACT|nr:MAG: hypothetical protein A2174_00520 [Candidatus Portnoybacteria bacterium RBG_13_41_18]